MPHNAAIPDHVASLDFDRTMQSARTAAHAPERATQQDWERVIAAIIIHKDAARREEVMGYAAALFDAPRSCANLAHQMLVPYFRVDARGGVDQITAPYPLHFKGAQIFLPKQCTAFANAANPFEALLEYTLPLEDAQRIAACAMDYYIVIPSNYDWGAEFLRKQMEEQPLQWARERIFSSKLEWMRREREVGRLEGSVAWDVMSERARASALYSVMKMALVEALHKLLKNK